MNQFEIAAQRGEEDYKRRAIEFWLMSDRHGLKSRPVWWVAKQMRADIDVIQKIIDEYEAEQVVPEKPLKKK